MAVGEERVVGQSADAVVTLPDTAPLAKQTLAYGLSGLMIPIVGIITLPIFARVFTRAEYGLLELGTTLLAVALAVTDAGLTAAALRSFYDYSSEAERERRSVMLTGFVATTLISLAVAGVLIALREDVSRWVFGRPGEARLMIVIAASIPAINTLRYVSEVMRVRLQAFDYLATTLIAALITTTLSVVGVLALDWRVLGVFFAGLIGNLVAAGYGLGLVRGGLAGHLSWQKLKPMLTYGLPLVPAAFAAWALSLADRIILSRLGSLGEVGQYAIANRLASLLLIGLTAFLFALTPFLLSIYSENPPQEKAARARALTYLTFILTLTGLVFTLFARELIDVLAPRFDEAYKAVGPLMLGMIGYGIVSLLTMGFSIARKTGRLAVLTVTAAGINIGLNFVLIPLWGIVGAALATTIAYGLLAVAYYVAAQRVYHTPYELKKIVTMVVLGSALGVLGVVPLGTEAVLITVKLLAIAAFLAGLWLTHTVRGPELTELRKFVVGMVPLPLRRASS
jgi:O-antigen/teichoic acid export membrane protein